MTNIYKVVLINGDYAELKSENNENTVALALLPEGIDEGDYVVFQLISYVRCDSEGNVIKD